MQSLVKSRTEEVMVEKVVAVEPEEDVKEEAVVVVKDDRVDLLVNVAKRSIKEVHLHSVAITVEVAIKVVVMVTVTKVIRTKDTTTSREVMLADVQRFIQQELLRRVEDVDAAPAVEVVLAASSMLLNKLLQ